MRNNFAYVVELRDLLDRYKARKELYPIYNVMPLSEIVDLLLRCFYDQDFFEILNHELDDRIAQDSNYSEYIDVFLRDIFLSEIIEDVEEMILTALGREFEIANYKLNEWVSGTAVILIQA